MGANIPLEEYDHKGCTANVLLIKNNFLYVANAGDARCILSVNGKVFTMSTDHKPQVLTEKHRIMKAGSVITAEGRIDGNLNLSRAIGDLAYKKRPKLKVTE